MNEDAMKVYLLKNIERVGMAGEIIKVSDGYGANYLIPHKLAVAVTGENEGSFKQRAQNIERRTEVIATQTSMLAEKINAITITLKRKMHNDGKLYGAVSQGEIADLLSEKGISVSKSQVDMPKSIKEKGVYEVTIKLSSRLQPTITLKVISE